MHNEVILIKFDFKIYYNHYYQVFLEINTI